MTLRMPKDPRWFQIAFLTAFLGAGVAFLDFNLPVWQPPVILGTAWLTQALWTRLLKVPPAGYLSPTITALGLSILLRVNEPWLAPFAAAAAISSKFLLRFRGKHVFNPANFGLAAAMLVSSQAWCSPSQWGENAMLLAWFGVLGCAVTVRAFRADISFAFLAAWLAAKAGRVLYLGQRPPVLLHQLAAGSLIIFAFFMISDPKTSPSHRAGRLLYAALVAGLGMYLQHALWWQNALIWSLFLTAPLVPLIDLALRHAPFAWPERKSPCLPVSAPLS